MKPFFLLGLIPATLAAQTMQLTDQLGRTVLYDDIALTPDGTRVAWSQSTAATTSTQVYIGEVSGNQPASAVKLDTDDNRTDSGPAWSPDSKTLAFFSTSGEKDQPQLWIANADGSHSQKLTRLKGYAAHPRWSHDGRRIAFLYIEGGPGGGPLRAAPPMTGIIDTAIHNQRIAVLDLSSGEVHQVSPPNLHIYDYDWSPDDRTFVTTAAPGPGNNNWWIAQIYTIDVTTGTATPIYKPALQIAVPRWSPDGKSVAFIEGLMSDEGFHGGDLFTISAAGHDPVNRTRGRMASVSSLFWLKSDRILFTEFVGGGSAVSELKLANNAVQTIWKGAESVHAFGNFPNFAVASDGKVAAVARSTYDTPPEIWAGPVGLWRQLTHNNSSQSPSWAKAESLEWHNDGFTIQGWILPPARLEANKKYPMIVLIHGGPSGIETPAWPAGFGMWKAIIGALSSRGYYVLMPNPRGSYGQGEDFTRGNVKDFGGGDLRDILAGVDAAIARYPIDQRRLGVTGWSYGGYMTMWTVTQTDRFRGAVAGAGIANWQSYYGQNLIDQWMIPFFGSSIYDDPAVYEKSSPIRYIKNAKTPSLILVGERDAECPAPQSYEFWHALRTLGVPTQLIVYPGEGHLFTKPENQIDRLNRTVDWFDEHLK